MSLGIRDEAPAPAALSEHAAIPIAFVAGQILEVRLLDGGLGCMSLTQTAVTAPYVKDYDALEGAGPQRWPGRFDVSNWGLIGARRDGASAGGAVIATRTLVFTCPAAGTTWPYCRTSGYRRGNGGHRAGAVPGRPRTGRAPAASAGSRSRLRTSTFRPAASTRR